MANGVGLQLPFNLLKPIAKKENLHTFSAIENKSLSEIGEMVNE